MRPRKLIIDGFSKRVATALLSGLILIFCGPQLANAGGGNLFKQGVKLLDELFSASPTPKFPEPKKPPRDRYNRLLPRGSTPASAKYPPGMWNIVTQFANSKQLSESQLSEVVNAYRNFYYVQQSDMDRYMAQSLGVENVELPNENRKIIEWSFNYDEMIVGALIGRGYDPILSFSIDGSHLRYEKRIINKLRACIRFLRGIDVNRDDFTKQVIERVQECESVDANSREFASIEFDVDQMELSFNLLKYNKEPIGQATLSVQTFIDRAQNALFDQQGYLFSDEHRQATRIRKQVTALADKCKEVPGLLKTRCKPSPRAADRYELRQCIWADEFLRSPWYPKSVPKLSLTCKG